MNKNLLWGREELLGVGLHKCLEISKGKKKKITSFSGLAIKINEMLQLNLLFLVS